MKYYWLVHFNYINEEENAINCSRLYLVKHYNAKKFFFDMVPDFDKIVRFIRSEFKGSKLTLHSISITRRDK